MPVRKNTVFLTNSPTLQALTEEGHFYCGHNRCCAFRKQMHESVSVRGKMVRKKVIATGHNTTDVTAFPLMLTQFLAKAIDVDVSKLSGSFKCCENTQCAFVNGHQGLCSHMMVKSNRAPSKAMVDPTMM